MKSDTMKKLIGALVLAGLPGNAVFAQSAPPAAKPNVVVILADDLGYGDLGCYGATKIKTPNIDRLASEGCRFTHAYTPSSVCSPTRYGVLSGSYAWRTPRHPANQTIRPDAPLAFSAGQPTLASLFKSAGYSTACVGKWHLGFGEGDDLSIRYDWSRDEIKPGPLEVGFDYFFGLAANVSNQPHIFIENHRFFGIQPGKKVTVTNEKGKEVLPWSPDAEYKNDHVAGDLTRKAVEFIERSKDKRFFLYFAPNIPHNPITPSAEFIGKSGCGLYGDFVQELDSHVGTLLDVLKKAGVADNTLIVFSSDNGGVCIDSHSPKFMIENYPENFAASEAGHKICGDLRGKKHSIYDGGFRVPFIVRWPGQVPADSKCDSVVGLTDLFATFSAMLGKDVPSKLDSVNTLPLWKGEPGATGRDSLVLRSAIGNFAIRKGDWKLIEQAELEPQYKGFAENKNQLYKVSDDPSETTNLWDSNPELVRERAEMLKQIKGQERGALP
ncbi:MAG: arylsulfatase [Verrucomicrobiaceae bacterium]|nr:MAG: arylsulfatase [Verrucomicrobiaceae bacterium]